MKICERVPMRIMIDPFLVFRNHETRSVVAGTRHLGAKSGDSQTSSARISGASPAAGDAPECEEEITRAGRTHRCR